MPKYLSTGSYTPEGLRGLHHEGASARRAALEKLAESAGGKLEEFYLAFGENDFYFVFDFPDNVAAAAASMIANASGAIHSHLVVLLTAEEIDEASRRTPQYRAPHE
jgi:uncharacterized protein with GYD domain